jgi:protein-L-isoaspartate(D-aspartate) O-methyltransferase
VTAGAESLPWAFLDQLADGGRLVIPLGIPPEGQRLHRFTRKAGRITIEDLGGFVFVPLRGAELASFPDL